MQIRTLAALAALCFTQISCGDKVTVNPATKGEAGESCTSRDDCGSGLSCLAGRCAAEGTNSDGGTTTITGGKAGESCTWRGDCQPTLACIDQTCVEDTESVLGDSGMPVQRRGDRGETCTARNDCKENLACVAGRCRENEYDLTVLTKACYRVECQADPDCCKNFVAPSYCPTEKAKCEATMAAVDCNFYNRNCFCTETCQDEMCEEPNRCTTSADCGNLLCVGQKCVECAVKADCALYGALYECVDGACRTGCTRNEQCPLFNNCQSGKCVDVGCSSDRECYFATNDPRSKCINKDCKTPCENDAECTATEFAVCQNGSCVDVGCESDVECRAALDLNSLPRTTSATAVCRVPPAK